MGKTTNTRFKPVRALFNDGTHADFASAVDAAIYFGTTSIIIHNLAQEKTKTSRILSKYDVFAIKYLDNTEYNFKVGETIKF